MCALLYNTIQKEKKKRKQILFNSLKDIETFPAELGKICTHSQSEQHTLSASMA